MAKLFHFFPEKLAKGVQDFVYLQKPGYARQFENKFSLRSFALSLQKSGCTRQFENKFSLHAFAPTLQPSK
ncbi:hypothetical protein [Segatella maculosa]|uniref:hypothetical protein n=1 Tax=Segatella maculosa TaxID=439703 RepID=UPI0023F594A3|nr:hypothetical protein [Segatella maculosa]